MTTGISFDLWEAMSGERKSDFIIQLIFAEAHLVSAKFFLNHLKFLK